MGSSTSTSTRQQQQQQQRIRIDGVIRHRRDKEERYYVPLGRWFLPNTDTTTATANAAAAVAAKDGFFQGPQATTTTSNTRNRFFQIMKQVVTNAVQNRMITTGGQQQQQQQQQFLEEFWDPEYYDFEEHLDDTNMVTYDSSSYYYPSSSGHVETTTTISDPQKRTRRTTTNQQERQQEDLFYIPIERSTSATRNILSSPSVVPTTTEDDSYLLCSTKTKMKKQRKSKKKKKEELQQQQQQQDTTYMETEEERKQKEKEIIQQGLIQPYISKRVWNLLEGDELLQSEPKPDDPTTSTLPLLEKFTNICYRLVCMKDHNNIPKNFNIHWSPSYPKEDEKFYKALEQDKEIFIFTGTHHKDKHEQEQHEEYVGSNTPLIKSISILPLPPKEIIDLLMDSSRIQLYNKLSIGRKDLRVVQHPPEEEKITKLVRNYVQLPVTHKKVMTTSLLHGRKISHQQQKDAYLFVSRVIHGTKYDTSESLSPEEKKMGTSYMLLGINLLEPVGTNECRMTAITHAYQPGLPAVLSKKVGIQSAINFVKDIRAMCLAAEEDSN